MLWACSLPLAEELLYLVLPWKPQLLHFYSHGFFLFFIFLRRKSSPFRQTSGGGSNKTAASEWVHRREEGRWGFFGGRGREEHHNWPMAMGLSFKLAVGSRWTDKEKKESALWILFSWSWTSGKGGINYLFHHYVEDTKMGELCWNAINSLPLRSNAKTQLLPFHLLFQCWGTLKERTHPSDMKWFSKLEAIEKLSSKSLLEDAARIVDFS